MVTFSNSFWEFLCDSDSRIACFIKRARRGCYAYAAYERAITNAEIDFLTLRNDGTISYLPAGKEHIVNEDGRWAREGRQNGKPSKVIRKILSKNAQRLFSDKDFEQFVNSYKAAGCAGNMTFRVHPNVMIPEIYCRERESGEGSLNNSCMNDDVDYLKLYTIIKEVKILAMYNEGGQLAGRALLWDIGNGKTLMDRVYVTKDHYYELFLDYASENGFSRRVHYKCYDYKDRFTDDNGATCYQAWYKFYFDETKVCTYPYIDTFTYGGDGYITNDEDDNEYTYNQTDGSREDNESEDSRSVYDELNSRYIDEDESRYIDRGRYRGYFIHYDDSVEIDGEWWWDCDENIVFVAKHDRYYIKDDCQLIDGEWVHEDDAVYCKVDDCWYRRDDCIELHNGEYCLFSEATSVDGLYYHKTQEVPC
jgi:hypothetical protein